MESIIDWVMIFAIYGGFCLWHTWICFSGIGEAISELKASEQHKALLAMIEAGDWVYSGERLDGEVKSYGYRTWQKDHAVSMFFLVLIWMPAGFVVGLAFAAVIMLNGANANKYEEHLVRLKSRKNTVDREPVTHASADGAGVTKELANLFELKQKGAISDSEFAVLKEKLLKRA